MTVVNGQSPQWEHISNTRMTPEAVAELSGFKSGAVNFKLGLWDTGVNGVRYLKALTYNLAATLSEPNWDRLRRIHNRDVGDPISVTYHGESVCMDYLRAVYELEFIADRAPLDGARVLEIGAGFGRTCHALLANHDIVEYVIVDLATTLELARNYLSEVLPPHLFERLRFVPVERTEEELAGLRFDLCVNIDSFAEMTPETVGYYLSLVDRQCERLYVNNPVGKYLDKSLDGHTQGEEIVKLALSTGLLRDVIDIHDDRAVAAQSRKFLDAYRPGDGWTCVGESWAVPWSYYWQALYAR
ncbi:putative sugar O-methyltransferase [Saccharothrix deserti]|uniref:putative sugar O-methyltransferase n=1 Tax=Saccharothrix deserti TaxID=2593674 RepID=UPI00131EA436|nr:putative sugar O-methyltransferase [Saccharothrix deserti]